MSKKIYKITNKVNNKIYVGKTIKTLDQRLHQHFQEALRWKNNNNKYNYNSKLYPAIVKYGKDNFEISLLAEFDDNINLEEMEIFYIKELNALDDNIGYNISPGGKGGPLFKGHKHSDGVKKLLSDKNYWKTHKQPREFVEKRIAKHRRYYQNLTTLKVILGCYYNDPELNEIYSVCHAANSHRKIRGSYWIKLGSDISKKLSRYEADKIIADYDKEYDIRKKEKIKQTISTRKHNFSLMDPEQYAEYVSRRNLKVKNTRNNWSEEKKKEISNKRKLLDEYKFKKKIENIDIDKFILDYYKLPWTEIKLKYNITAHTYNKLRKMYNLHKK